MTAITAVPQLREQTAARRLLDHVDARAADGCLMILFSTGTGCVLADLLEQNCGADPAATLAASIHDAMATAGVESFDLGGNLYAFVTEPYFRVGTVVGAARAAVAEHAEVLAAESLYGDVLLPDEAGGGEQAVSLAARRMRGRSTWREIAGARQTRDVLLRALEERGLAGDIDRTLVTANAVAVGRRFGLPLEQLEILVRAAELQDVGKFSIPDAILSKAGRLTADEWSVVRRHPLVGERIINGAPALAPVARLVRSCYERWDGSGYPDGLAEEQIPLGARIIAVCVAFSAMTAARPYRPPMTQREALVELRGDAGIRFDPAVVDAFCTEVDTFPC